MKPYRRWGILGCCVAGILVTAALLALSNGRVDRRDVVPAVLAAALLAVSGAVLGPFRRRWLAAVAGLILAAAAIGAGTAASLHRDVRKRSDVLPAMLRQETPDLSPVLEGYARGDRDGASRALFDHFRDRPRVDLRTNTPLPAEQVMKQSDQVLSSVFEFFEGRPVQLEKDLFWGEDPLRDVTWQWFLHAMGYLLPLTERFRISGDTRFLQKAEDLVLDWIDDNYLQLLGLPSRLAWHDHVTALRVRAWLELWEDWVRSPLASPEEVEKLLTAIAVHGAKIADPEFYTAGHNHGIEQDIALMAIGTAFPELDSSAAWVDLACRRLEEQVRRTISPRGVHLEHSSNYHVFVLEMLTQALDFARRHDLACARSLEATLEGMARFTAYLLRPDGRLPCLGDSDMDPPRALDDPVLSRFAAKDAVLRYALSRGAQGSPGETAIVYAEEGYAIFRDGWRPENGFENGFHLVFTAAAHEGRAHKQADDLSFVLFAGGRDLLVDPGIYGYDSRDPERRYVMSAAAHSVVLVDGRDFTGFTARIGRHVLGDRYALVEASHENYPGVRHVRTLLHVRPATIFLIDRLEGRGADGAPRVEHDFEQLFHLAEGLETSVEAGGSVVRAGAKEGGSRLRITQLAGGRGTGRIIKGQQSPLQGWTSPAYRKLVPAPVASFRERGQEARLVTWIEVESPESDPAAPAAGAATEEGGRTILHWTSGGRARTATVDTSPGGIQVEVIEDG